MNWENYTDKADRMFCEVFDTSADQLNNHTQYPNYADFLGRVSWFEIKTDNFDRAKNWLKQKRYANAD